MPLVDGFGLLIMQTWVIVKIMIMPEEYSGLPTLHGITPERLVDVCQMKQYQLLSKMIKIVISSASIPLFTMYSIR